MFVSQLVVSSGFSMVIPFLSLYAVDLGSQTNFGIELIVGFAYAAPGLTMMIAAPIWGNLADRFGRKMMVQRTMLGGAIVILLMGFARIAEEIVLLRALQGVITGTMSASNALVASVVPRDRAGYAMSTLQVGNWAGLALGPLVGGFAADSFGYRVAFYMTATLLLMAGLLIHFGVSEKFVRPLEAHRFSSEFRGGARYIFNAPAIKISLLIRFLSNLSRTMLLPVMPLFILALVTNQSRVNTLTGIVMSAALITSTMTAIYLGA